MSWQQHIPESVKKRYAVYDYHHAACILSHEFQNEFRDIIGVLDKFSIDKKDILASGGNESEIPKTFSSILRPLGWLEEKLSATVSLYDGTSYELSTHKIDYFKNSIAFDLEWNSKEQTFDRDLHAFKTFHEFGKISLGIIVTSDMSLDKVLKELAPTKYGASTTTLKKLLPRLQSNGQGGCPLLVFGITPEVIYESDRMLNLGDFSDESF